MATLTQHRQRLASGVRFTLRYRTSGFIWGLHCSIWKIFLASKIVSFQVDTRRSCSVVGSDTRRNSCLTDMWLLYMLAFGIEIQF